MAPVRRSVLVASAETADTKYQIEMTQTQPGRLVAAASVLIVVATSGALSRLGNTLNGGHAAAKLARDLKLASAPGE